MKAKPITFAKIFATSQARSERWHAGAEKWILPDWSNAIAGECGEMCNAVKKHRRVTTGAPNVNTEPGRQLDEINGRRKIIRECCDMILYMPMLLQMLNCSAEEFEANLRDVFNRKSEEYGFPERL